MSMDGGAFAAAISPVQLNALAEGAHTFLVRAKDAAGNIDPTPASATWTVDFTSPTAKIIFPTPVSYTDAQTLTVRGTASDSNGIAAVSVNSVAATTTNGFDSWSATVPIADGQHSLIVSVTDHAGNVNTGADSVQVTNNGFLQTSLTGIAGDSSHNRLVTVDGSARALVAVDPVTGTASIISDAVHGTGPNFDGPDGLVVEPGNNRALVIDQTLDLLIAIDLTSGVRSVVSGPGISVETQFNFPAGLSTGITLGPANHIYVSTFTTDGKHPVVDVDLTSGTRTVVSRNDTTGTGIPFGQPLDIAYDNVTVPATPRLLVADRLREAIIAVDITTGNRSVLSSLTPFGTSDAGRGTGDALQNISGIALDGAHNRLLVVDDLGQRQTLVAIDLVSGDRTTLIDAVTTIEDSTGSRLTVFDNDAFVGDRHTAEIVRVNLDAPFTHQTLTSPNIGSGPKLEGPEGIVFLPSAGSPGSILIGDTFIDGVGASKNRIVHVDLANGNRDEVSGPSRGVGPALAGHRDIVLDTVTNSAAPRALVIDGESKTLMAVDIATGDRTTISGPSVGTGPDIGNGTNFANDVGLALDGAHNRALTATFTSLIAIDLTTGNRSIISDATHGTGQNLILAKKLALDDVSDPAHPRALVSDRQAPFGLTVVDLTTGNRSSLLVLGTGGDITFDRIGVRALVIGNHQEVLGIDPVTGRNTHLSGGDPGAVIGTGPLFPFESMIDVDPEKGIAFVVSDRQHAVTAVDLFSGDRVFVAR